VTHALLGIGSLEDLLGHPVAGPSWEGFVLEQLLTAETAVNASYYRTSAGAELDLVIAGRRAQTYVVEVKRASAPTVGPGFWNGCEDVGAKEAIVAYSGDEEIPLGDGVRALGVRDAIDWVRERR
jgi:uncharacterized protein